MGGEHEASLLPSHFGRGGRKFSKNIDYSLSVRSYPELSFGVFLKALW